jgi:hypothetical protein
VNSNGYFTTQRNAAVWSVRMMLNGTPIAQVRPDGWTLLSAFVIGKQGSQTTLVQVLNCFDDQAASNHLSSCYATSGVPTLARVRLVNLSLLSPAVDFCVSEEQTASLIDTPILRYLNEQNGLPYQSISAFLEVPAMSDIHIKVIPASASSSCSETALAEGSFPGSYELTWELRQPDPAVTTYELHFNSLGNSGTPGDAGIRFRNAVFNGWALDLWSQPTAGGTDTKCMIRCLDTQGFGLVSLCAP